MKKATHTTKRNDVLHFQQIVNVGPATAADFEIIELHKPTDLIGKDPFQVYESICKTDGHFHDPCVLDTVWSAIDFMNGNPPKKWWDFTARRKRKFGNRVQLLRESFQ